MTAYGRIMRASPVGRWLIEIHSVNKKTLDFTVFLPKDFLEFRYRDPKVALWGAEKRPGYSKG